MPTYIELKEQAEKLLAQAEELRQREIQQAIEDIKSKMQAYGITPAELGIAGARARTPTKTRVGGRSSEREKKSDGAVKYRGPNGEPWAGGRGRKPRWLTEALASGKRLEDFEAR